MNLKTLTASSALLLITLAGTACDRRNAEPIEPADSATTVIDDSPATVADPTPNDVDGPCAGLTGQAVEDCERRIDPEAAPVPQPGEPNQVPASGDNPTPVGD